MFEAAEKYNKDKENGIPLYLNVDFDMKKYEGNLSVKVWLYPNLFSFKFLVGLLKYAEKIRNKVQLNLVFRIKSRYELGYESESIVQ